MLGGQTISDPVAHDSGAPRLNLRWTSLRWILAIVLLAAAGLKAYQLARAPVMEPGLLNQRWLLAGVVELELVLGTWLLIGTQGLRTWTFTLVVWLTFLGVASYEAVLGASSCGCFGQFHVKPVYTAGFDLVAVLALLFSRPRRDPEQLSPPALGAWRRALLILIALGGIASGAWDIRHYSGGVPSDQGMIVADGVTILEPEKWAGHSFPLTDSIDAGDSLTSGNWLVVLYRSDCDHCQRAVPKYEQLARQNKMAAGSPGVALIEMPPYADAGQQLVGPDSAAVRGKLSDKHEWFAQTPVVIKLVDGKVVAAAEGEQAEDPAAFSGAATAR